MKARFTKRRGKRGVPFQRRAGCASGDSTGQVGPRESCPEGTGAILTSFLCSHCCTRVAAKEMGETPLAPQPTRLAQICHQTDPSISRCCFHSEPSPTKQPKETDHRSKQLRHLSELKPPAAQICSSVHSKRRSEASLDILIILEQQQQRKQSVWARKAGSKPLPVVDEVRFTASVLTLVSPIPGSALISTVWHERERMAHFLWFVKLN